MNRNESEFKYHFSFHMHLKIKLETKFMLREDHIFKAWKRRSPELEAKHLTDD